MGIDWKSKHFKVYIKYVSAFGSVILLSAGIELQSASSVTGELQQFQKLVNYWDDS